VTLKENPKKEGELLKFFKLSGTKMGTSSSALTSPKLQMRGSDCKFQMNPLSSKNYQLKFKTLGKLPNILEKSIEYILNLIKENQKLLTCNQLDLETLGSPPILPQTSPNNTPRM
jgi:hypothetical protein